MPSFVFLATVLSMDVARILVAAGYGLGYDTDAAAGSPVGAGRFTGAKQPSTGNPYPPLAIVGCTGIGVPVVITTAYPHGVSARGIGGMACIISGVTGNTAANNISTAPEDVTVGLAQGVLAVPVSATQLALYGQDANPASATVGQPIALVGNGAWTGGGTVTPALTDGQILVGQDNVAEHSAPPRIVLVPRGTGIGPDDVSVPNANRTAERRLQVAQRSLGSDALQCDIHCWGQRLPVPDAVYDFDITLALSQAFRASSYLLFGQSIIPGAGVWDDDKARATQLIKAGHLLSFPISIDVPNLDVTLGYVPPGTTLETTVQSSTPQTAQIIDTTLS